MDKKEIVVVGGGTGTHTVLRGLKRYSEEFNLTAIVSMADSGGSTGRLRDEFGQLPTGDVRNALTALAAEGEAYSDILRQLFLYRFSRGEGLYGHNFGNLFLTVLTDILGSEVLAIEAASRILRIAGQVIPVTTDNVHLRATYADGQVVVGENDIDEWEDESRKAVRITELSLTPRASLNPVAREALLKADLIVLGPGDLYTSILANCVVDGFAEAVQSSRATLIYVCNLMSRAGQTVGMNAQEHLDEIIRYVGKAPVAMLLNSDPLPVDLLAKYKVAGDHQILNNCQAEQTEIIELPLLTEETIVSVSGDALTRSLIRHDSHKLATAIRDFVR